ncbi:hypothetical protein M4R22_01750 [Acidovorax sp. GBBC 3334]|uniref:hypothetical protein n=1 Tax=Acidovorax sp. GBBC 3334 TaxID=2940496 RepID=UPI00230496E2|nr:hypothetical protein [Acidovorax sp. GBBC 3334]MDA8453475.1 hypothetical protein [Acidovorax sp. GBBC 3334]
MSHSAHDTVARHRQKTFIDKLLESHRQRTVRRAPPHQKPFLAFGGNMVRNLTNSNARAGRIDAASACTTLFRRGLPQEKKPGTSPSRAF